MKRCSMFALAMLCAFILPRVGLATASIEMNRSCQDLFRPGQSPSSTLDSYRQKLERTALAEVQDIQKALRIEMKRYRQYAEFRFRSSPELVLGVIGQSDALACARFDGLETVPELSNLTLEAMAARESAHEPESQPRDSKNLALLRRRLEADPYFTWLKHNALEFKTRSRISLVTTKTASKDRLVQIDPVDMFLHYRDVGLDADVALIQVESHLDPVLPEPARVSAARILIHSLALSLLERKFLPYLAVRDLSATSPAAWSQMSSLIEGRENLRRRFDDYVGFFDSIFPRLSFERVVARAKRDGTISVIAKYNSQKRNGASEDAILRLLHDELVDLRRDLGLRPDFALADVYSAVRFILARKADISYEAFLLLYFDPPSGVPAAAEVLELRRLVEIAETFDVETRALARLYQLARDEQRKFERKINFKN